MSERPVVSNSSPLIALEQVRKPELLSALFGTVWIPPAVVAEVAPTIPVLPSWLTEQALSEAGARRALGITLGPGESEAIALALECNPEWLLLDERAARRAALGLGLPVIGTLGILLAAKRRGLLAAIKPVLELLADADFRVAPDLYDRVLRDAGEAP